jgi:membrane protease YdiL (CAAX protease family)
MENGLNKMFEFGRHEHSLFGNIKNVFTAFVANLLWTMFLVVFLHIGLGMKIDDIHLLISAQLTVSPAQPTIQAVIFFACIFAPLWEELAFRFVPLKIARFVQPQGNLKDSEIVLPVMIGTSIIFGLAHGSVVNILMQGVSGMSLAWVMIKSGYKYSVLTHAMWNFMLMIGLPIVLGMIK